MVRPQLHDKIDPDTFDSYYWYRHELQALAKDLGLSCSGGKFDIHDRISHYLRTGEALKPVRRKTESDFDWATESLSVNTLVTDSYKNTENVRAFFRTQIGQSFKFNIDLMNFMKDNLGVSLSDAIQFYKNRERSLQNGYSQPIEEHNQFNLYTREFLADNLSLQREDVNVCWAGVIDQPRPGSKGRGIRYSKEDLKYLCS